MRRRRHRRRLGALAAIEGEKVEYFLPASIFNALGSNTRNVIAGCFRDVEKVLPNIDRQAAIAARKASSASLVAERITGPDFTDLWGPEYAARLQERGKSKAKTAKSKSKASDIFTQTAAEIRKDVAELRAKGVTGPIPMCVYRTSGKYGDKALKSAEARANRSHERFHADARREEYKAGRQHAECDDNIRSVLPELDQSLLTFSQMNWAPGQRTAAEEILARVEEVQHACAASSEDCAVVGARINDWFIAKKRPQLAEAFMRVTDAVKARFSSPIGVVKAACRVNLRGLTRNQKAFVAAAVMPFVPPL